MYIRLIEILQSNVLNILTAFSSTTNRVFLPNESSNKLNNLLIYFVSFFLHFLEVLLCFSL